MRRWHFRLLQVARFQPIENAKHYQRMRGYTVTLPVALPVTLPVTLPVALPIVMTLHRMTAGKFRRPRQPVKEPTNECFLDIINRLKGDV